MSSDHETIASLHKRIAQLEAELEQTRESDEERTKRERLLQNFFQNAASGIVISDKNGKFVSANDRWQRLIGRDSQELATLSPVEFTHPDDLEPTRQNIKSLLNGEVDFYRYEKRFIKKDGSLFWADVRASAIKDANGDMENMVCIINDISERKQAELALRESEWEKRNILDTISDFVIFQDLDHSILWANKSACEAVGLTNEEVKGRYCHDLWSDRKNACPDCPVGRAVQLNRPAEAEIVTDDGAVWWIKGYPIHNDAGEIAGVIEVARDVTDSKRIEREIKKAKDIAENANKMKNEFLANMSHELRSPLNGVLGMLDVLLDTNLDEDQRESIETALLAGEGLLAIINDILDFSKLQAHKITLSKNEFELRQTVNTVVNTFREQSKRKGVDVLSRIGDNLPETVIGDEGRIRQILFNLVGNSLKFTKSGEVSVDVHILRKTATPENARLLFTVTDTGIGIPEEEIETIFDPFTQLNWGKSRKYEGTGLGLGIVKRLVTLMGGIISVDSEVDRGTVVSFWINIGLPEAAQSLPKASSTGPSEDA